ncbi:hypothetical protein D2V93_08485 [Flagellimonas taeanensis]|nr:hypothetical protein D2V93_08485 [Allomuricauda taeanensis]
MSNLKLKSGIMKWTKVSERLPSVEIDGEKVLLYKTIEGREEAESMFIIDTTLIRHFWMGDNYWMSLPYRP